MVKVGIVIPAFNEPQELRECVSSLLDGVHRNFRVFIIDNGFLRPADRSWPDARIQVTATGENLGFCRACNLGMRQAADWGARLFWILNQDATVMPDTLAHLVRAAGNAEAVGAVGGKILYKGDEGRIWYAGGRLSLLHGVGKHYGHNRRDEGGFEDGRIVDYVTGCSVLIPFDVHRRVGGFNESMFMYLDDAEFCLRLKRAGLRIVYEPKAVVLHKVGPGSRRQDYSGHYLYFSIRNKPLVASSPLYRTYLHFYAVVLALAKMALYGLAPGVPSRWAKVRCLAWGLMDSFAARPRYRRRFPHLFPRRPG